jgi:hypothetical protein
LGRSDLLPHAKAIDFNNESIAFVYTAKALLVKHFCARHATEEGLFDPTAFLRSYRFTNGRKTGPLHAQNELLLQSV